MLVRCVNLRLFTRFDRGLRFPWKNKQTKTKQAWPQKSFSTTQKQPLDGITTLNYRNSPGVLSIMVYTESPPPPPERGTGVFMYMKGKGFHWLKYMKG